MTVLALRLAALAVAAVVVTALAGAADADDDVTIKVVLKDHRFLPPQIHVPAGKKIVLDIDNEDDTSEEFDSSALRVEKRIEGGQSGLVHIRPLAPGHYPFTGEFHFDTAMGEVIAE